MRNGVDPSSTLPEELKTDMNVEALVEDSGLVYRPLCDIENPGPGQ